MLYYCTHRRHLWPIPIAPGVGERIAAGGELVRRRTCPDCLHGRNLFESRVGDELLKPIDTFAERARSIQSE